MVEQRISAWLKDTSKPLDISWLWTKKWPIALEGKEHLIVKLNCGHNEITFLPSLPNCEELDCSYNLLTSLPSMPNCERLDCSGNYLTFLLPLPNCKRLRCCNNKLTTIPPLPNCKRLKCGGNNLTSLPPLPNCVKLYCNENNLTSLPLLPKCEILFCYDNKLTSLPLLPKCVELWCNYNKLFSNSLTDWKKIWKLREFYLSIHRDRGIQRFLKIIKLCLHLPRKNELHLELQYSPNHCGKFYKGERWSNKWSD